MCRGFLFSLGDNPEPMKNFFTILLIFFASCCLAQNEEFYSNESSVKLIEDKTDEFTKAKIKATSWEKIREGFDFCAYYQFRMVNGVLKMNVKIMDEKIHAIREGAPLMFKLSNDSIIQFDNIEYTIGCTGCGAIGISGSNTPGTESHYEISNEKLSLLQKITVSKFRIYFTEGYLECNIKPGSAETLKTAANLIK